MLKDTSKSTLWKLRNITAFAGRWVLGSQFGSSKSVAVFPVPFTNRRFWFKKQLENANALTMWRVEALFEIRDSLGFELRCEGLDDDGNQVVDLPVKRLTALGHEVKEGQLAGYHPNLYVRSSTDGSRIGDPDFALWLIRQGVTKPRGFTTRSRSSCIGVRLDKERKVSHWVAWNDDRKCGAFGIGDKQFNAEYLRVNSNTRYSKAGNFTIKNLMQARNSAFTLAKYLENY